MNNCSQFQRLLYFTIGENCISGPFIFKLTLLANDSDCLPKVCYLKLKKKLRYLIKLRYSESGKASGPLLERGLVLFARDDENVKASYAQHISIRECCIMAGRHSSNASALNTVQQAPNLRFHDCSSFCPT